MCVILVRFRALVMFGVVCGVMPPSVWQANHCEGVCPNAFVYLYIQRSLLEISSFPVAQQV